MAINHIFEADQNSPPAEELIPPSGRQGGQT